MIITWPGEAGTLSTTRTGTPAKASRTQLIMRVQARPRPAKAGTVARDTP
ncbi:MAG: hypothetical protein KA297_24135 [Kofleriaceae bacterium]|nr:hypothetical protein [Kofleriaceae bacterium]MBP6842018.1 hypothetical protein [Kofleriaceae bacterium]